MAEYAVKVLKDENGEEFVPYTSTKALYDPQGITIDARLATKLETASLIAGSGIALSADNVNHTVTISSSAPGSNLINNLTTTNSGIGALDAYQGYVLKTSVDALPKIYSGTADPSSSLGEDGDLYIKIE